MQSQATFVFGIVNLLSNFIMKAHVKKESPRSVLEKSFSRKLQANSLQPYEKKDEQRDFFLGISTIFSEKPSYRKIVHSCFFHWTFVVI